MIRHLALLLVPCSVLAHAVTVAEADRLFDKKRWHEAAKAYDELATRKAGGRESWRACLRAAQAREKGGSRKAALAGANRVIRDVLGHGNDDLVGEAFLLKQSLLFHAKSQSGVRNTLLKSAIARVGWTTEVSRLHENEAIQRLKEGKSDSAWKLFSSQRIVLSSVGSNVVEVLSFARTTNATGVSNRIDRIVQVLSALSAKDKNLAVALSDYVCRSTMGEDRLYLTCAVAEMAAERGDRKRACELYEELLGSCKDTSTLQRIRLRYADLLKDIGMSDRCAEVYAEWCRALKSGNEYVGGMKRYMRFLLATHRYRTANDVFRKFCANGTDVYTVRERQSIAKKIAAGLSAGEDDADMAIGWKMLAHAKELEHKEKYGDALKIYKAVAVRHAGGLRDTSMFRAGECYRAMGKFKAAAEAWDGLCVGQDTDLAALCLKRKGDMQLIDMRDVAGARNTYVRAIELVGDVQNEKRELAVSVAMCDLVAGRVDHAVSVFRQEYENAVRRKDVDVAKWHALVAAGEAARSYAMNAGSAFVDAVIADMMLAAGRIPLADRLFQRCLRRQDAPLELKAYLTMQRADCLVRMGDYKTALAVYEAMPTRFRNCECTPRAMLRAGVMCVGNMDDDMRGFRFFRLLEDSWPTSPFAEQAMFYRITLAIWTKRWELAANLRNEFVNRYPASDKLPVVTGEYSELIARRMVCLY